MDALKQRLNTAYNESFTQLMGGITAFFLVVWVSAGYAVYEIDEAPTNFKYLFAGICFLGWAGCIVLSIGAIEYWLREPLVQRAHDPNNDAIPLAEREPQVAAPIIAEH
ncbi:unnamed protein product [Caenorhabditis brenneri]